MTITPGLTELTRTFLGASSKATHLQVMKYFWRKGKVLEMSPGHLVKSSLGDVVGQDPLIAFSKVCLCGLERKTSRISELIFVTHTQGKSESR